MSRVWKSNQYKKSDRLEVAPLPIYTIDVIFPKESYLQSHFFLDFSLISLALKVFPAFSYFFFGIVYTSING